MRAISAIASIGLTVFAGMALAEEPNQPSKQPLGLYAGAQVGVAAANTVVPQYTGARTVDSASFGWSLFAGTRPGKYLGAEIGYIDFGKSKSNNITDGSANITYEASAKNSAFTATVLGYLPLATSWDLFARAGYARVSTKTDSNGNYPSSGVCDASGCHTVGIASWSTSTSDSDFIYGFGTQYRVDSLSIRLEYQKISASQARPDLLSVGVAWHF